jgi:hypothetical protein
MASAFYYKHMQLLARIARKALLQNCHLSHINLTYSSRKPDKGDYSYLKLGTNPLATIRR